MDFLNQIRTQLTAIWHRWDRAQRIGIGVVAAVCVAAVAGISLWAAKKEFVTLTNSLTPVQAHEIVSTLQAEGIEYQLNFSGSAVSVPVADISRAKIAIKQFSETLPDDESEATLGWWADPSQQRARQQRITERRLAASIEQMQSVRGATVHITRYEHSPFIRDQTPTKASVVLKLAPGGGFTSNDARAIVSLVSHAVENLDPENTIVVDTEGRVLSGSNTIGGDVSGQLEFRRKLESELSAKAEAMLVPLLGHGRAIVRVTSDIDFTETQTAKTSYNPDDKVKTRESISTETSRAPGQRTAGAGSASNLGGTGIQTQEGALSDIETIDTEYQNSETVDTIRIAPGQLKRLTIAAVVELPERDAADPAAAGVPAISVEQIEKIIRRAVGFDETRNDEIEVLSAKMTGVPDFAVGGGWLNTVETLAPLAKSASLGIASMIALILGLKMISRLKPVVLKVERQETIDPEVRARLADLSEEILQHPEAVSTVLAGWLAGQTGSPSADSKTSRRAA